MGKKGHSVQEFVGVSCKKQEVWLLILKKNASSGIMLYCSPTAHAVSRQEQYLVQRLRTFYTKPCYIPLMGNQQFTGYAGARRRMNSAEKNCKYIIQNSEQQS
jgi:hypothetical protein